MTEPVSIRIAGISGQGNILAGLILAKALVYEGKWVVQTQSYSAQVRGDVSYCDVLYDDSPIDYPESEYFDIVCILHQKAMDELYKSVKVNGVVILDQTFVKNVPDFVKRITRKILFVPATERAISEFKTAMVSNVIMVGVLAKVCNIVKLDSLKRALKDHVRRPLWDINLKALEFGYNMFEKQFKIKTERVWKRLAAGFE
ncbi:MULTISPECIES: 2-oxoacid:acceptor oxidoreductase family protein [Thermotoga]|jgi:2-oxoglutarate ferredoxin oxidoreductase subunit gamma|uniref:Keto/oxoacid ferredoxin oxidoreductase, gamma subunit, putative n=4 Tax=Thermotoga TaxID=2335 RepID=Q9WYN7_THEMA|nr:MULTISPECIES: 2-oxoacid:acceptor oxidoreductase family protein [Thermotoga]KUK23679.1 MAG: 2-oxoglutarate ferredoxin oxidoreductase, gamma subunit [Thermotoga petrophila]KUK33499.1 MAG: 2-oxoglutarate ferredoxin oxidoreductase, gamma subunit [Thermotoga sp. 47_83]MBZ4661325.1 2-oxoacid:ferredoxin oxidoreductase subunit gamma [Thermotoga sp.]AAD35491.1 keto/oxoacid ferredoxin oxidoreductase, gamma subunit, putative [Thermotoga maritima MSB8]ABQ46536.1 2-oxoglutarate ferredoxin oxidoreductase